MTERTRLFMLCGLTAGLLCLSACEDPAAERRAAALQAIEEATVKLANATGPVLPGSEDFDARRSELEAISRSLSNVRSDDGGQAASRSMLLSAVNRELADLHLSEASKLEYELNNERRVLARRIDAVRRLNATADGGDSINLTSIESQLESRRRQADDRIRAFSQVMSELDSPIGELDSANRADRTRVDDLSARANTLRREAADLGDADGFGHFREAVELEREADRYEAQIALREIDLDHDLRPQRALATAKAGQSRGVLEAIDTADRGLRDYSSSVERSVRQTREAAAALRGEIRQQLETLDAALDPDGGDLVVSYTEILDLLDQSARQASTAARAMDRRNAGSARVAESRIHALRGQVYLKMSQGLGEHAALLAAAAESGAASVSAELAAINARVTENLQKAREAYGQARDLAGQAGLTDRSGTALNAALDAALANLGVPIAAPPAGATNGAAPADAAPADTGSGAPRSHAALMRRLTAGEDQFDFLHASTPLGHRMLEASKTLTAVLEPVQAAMTERFGATGPNPFSSPADAVVGSTPELVNESATAATYALNAPAGRVEIPLVAIDGTWHVDFDELMNGAMPGGLTELSVSMMEQQARAMSSAIGDLPQRIRDGEFSSTEEVLMALTQAMMSGGQ